MNTPGKFNAIGTQVIFKSQDPHFHVYRIFNLGSAEMEVSYTDSAGNHAPSVHIQPGASLDITASEISVHGSSTTPAQGTYEFIAWRARRSSSLSILFIRRPPKKQRRSGGLCNSADRIKPRASSSDAPRIWASQDRRASSRRFRVRERDSPPKDLPIPSYSQWRRGSVQWPRMARSGL